MFDDLERRRAEIERHKENTARLATVRTKYASDGQGVVEFEDVVDFGLTFTEEPTFSYGCEVDLDDLADQLDIEPGEMPPIPLVTAMVTEWDRDNRDFYVGAWVAARVAFMPGDRVPLHLDVHLDHHFSFTGIAMKDIPTNLVD